MDCTMYVGKTNTLISCWVTSQLICILIYTYAKSRFFEASHIIWSTMFIPPHLCRGVYSFHLSVRLFVCSFLHTSFRRVEFASKFCVKVSQAYLSNYLSESIHIWTIVTLEGWHSLHDHGPQGSCPGVGLEVKI